MLTVTGQGVLDVLRGSLGCCNAWYAFIPFLAFSPAVRKLLCTTSAIESLNYQLRKVTKARGHFPRRRRNVKLLWLAIINIADKRAR